MKVTMAEMNKKASQIVRQVIESGETVMVLKHGKPVAEIRPISSDSSRLKALEYLCSIDPVPVSVAPETLLAETRNRGL